MEGEVMFSDLVICHRLWCSHVQGDDDERKNSQSLDFVSLTNPLLLSSFICFGEWESEKAPLVCQCWHWRNLDVTAWKQ